jgi:N-acylglucosamine-6-phosphate 2-epimerase
MLERGLIVSCQARPDNPLHGPVFMAAMARAAQQGGAVGLRANAPENVRAIKAVSDLPVIGIHKVRLEGFEVEITPALRWAQAVAEAGADVIALDATGRTRPEGSAGDLIARVKGELGLPVFADVATFEEGLAAAEAGADYVATTLAGYTRESVRTEGPELALLERLCRALDVPVVGEGRFDDPRQVAAAFACGAFAVVVGTAITNPREITRRFARAVPAR